MIEDRFVITDGLWTQLEPCLPGKISDSGVTAKSNRLFLEAVLWRVRTGSPSSRLWQLEHSVSSFSPMGKGGCF